MSPVTRALACRLTLPPMTWPSKRPLMAMLAACRIGVQRIGELLAKYGRRTVREACEEAIARGVRRIRAEEAG